MSTVANIKTTDSSHWYYSDARPCYELPKKDGSGMKVPTLADARKLNLLPSVTTILKCLDKPALTAWKIEQAVLAAMTTPRIAGEADDVFINRVLNIEKVQEEEGSKARELGSRIHDAIEKVLNGTDACPPVLAAFVAPAVAEAMALGRVVATEKIAVGSGYAGKLDCIVEAGDMITVLDFKTTKRLPKESYKEHELQLAAYASTLGNTGVKKVQTANIYISSVEAGKIQVCINESWNESFAAFQNILNYWQWATGYKPLPTQPKNPPLKISTRIEI